MSVSTRACEEQLHDPPGGGPGSEGPSRARARVRTRPQRGSRLSSVTCYVQLRGGIATFLTCKMHSSDSSPPRVPERITRVSRSRVLRTGSAWGGDELSEDAP